MEHKDAKRQETTFKNIDVAIDGQPVSVETMTVSIERLPIYGADDKLGGEPSQYKRDISVEIETDSGGWDPEDGAGYIPTEEGGSRAHNPGTPMLPDPVFPVLIKLFHTGIFSRSALTQEDRAVLLEFLNDESERRGYTDHNDARKDYP